MKTINITTRILFIGLLLFAASCLKNEDFNPVPTIVSVRPTAAIPGDSVVLFGSNFSKVSSENIVSFGDAQASVKVATPNSLIVTVPDDGKDGLITVKVKDVEGSSLSNFDVLNELTISAISPTEAKALDKVIISGIYFDTDATKNEITFNGLSAEVVSATLRKLEVIIPENAQPGKQEVLLKAHNQTAMYSDFSVSLVPPFYFTKLVASPVTTTLNKVHLIDTNIAYAVGSSSVVLKTTNGGASWRQLSTTGPSTTYRDVFALDTNTVIVCGSDGILIKSDDGGDTWKQIDVNTTERLRRLTFVNATTGWLVGSGGLIYKTIDGGNSWSKQVSGTTLSLYSACFNDDQNGFVVGDDGVALKTTNGGKSWETFDPGTTKDFSSVLFKDAQSGWITGDDNMLFATVDGGETWVNQEITLADAGDDINDITVMSNGTIIAVADDHQIVRSEDGGANWVVLDKQVDINDNTIEHLEGIDSFANIAVAVGVDGIIIQ